MKKVIKVALLLLGYLVLFIIGHILFPERLKLDTGIAVWLGILVSRVSALICEYKKRKNRH